jgi:hypothetical protein
VQSLFQLSDGPPDPETEARRFRRHDTEAFGGFS